jgi:signal transduction histidine kinase
MTTMQQGPTGPAGSTLLESAATPRRQVVDRTRPVSSVRVVLILGFTAIFALWLVWGYQLVQNLAHIQRNVESLRKDYVRGQQALSTVRTNVLLGSIYLRDALIDSAADRREYYRNELTRLRDEIETLLAAHLRYVSPAERDRWARLQEELGEYWTSRDVAFTPNTRTPIQSYLLLRKRVVPKRDGVLQIVDQVLALQTAARLQQEQETTALYAEVRARLMRIGGLTLIGALAAAVLATRGVSRLHHQVEQQRLEERRIRRDLERLSAGLVEVQERERREISRELHDAVGQALTAVKLDLGIALRSDVSDRTRAALDEAKDITETTLQNVRDLSQLLHPSTLDDFGLPETLRTYLERFAERTGIRAQLMVALPERLPPEIEASLYRIIQEATNNIARHSHATACTVTINTVNGGLQLVIDDNGRGLQASGGHGLGLIAMRERALAHGGSFAIESPVIGGTRVTVTTPIPQTVTIPVSRTA